MEGYRGTVIVDYVVPVPDPRQWGVHHDPASDPVAVLCGECIPDHVADIVRDKSELSIEAELMEHRGDIPGLAFLIVALFGVRREAHAAEVRHDDGMIVGKLRRERCPHIPSVAEAVQ